MPKSLLFVMPFFLALTACLGNSSGGGGAAETLYCDANAGEHNPAIFGGRRVHRDSWIGRGVVAILTEDALGRKSICTGSLIDRNIVLTAAHCVDRFQIASRTKVLFTAEPLCDYMANAQNSLHDVSEVRIHSGYSSVTGGDDLAMFRLAKPAPANYGTLKLVGRTFDMRADTQVLLTGYGTQSDYNTSKQTDPHDLKYTYVRPYAGSDFSKSLLQMATSPLMYFDQRGGSGACAGDSGGPALARNADGEYRVIGVASKVDNLDQADFQRQEDVTCRIGIAHTSVAKYATWIEDAFAALRNSDSFRSRAIDY